MAKAKQRKPLPAWVVAAIGWAVLVTTGLIAEVSLTAGWSTSAVEAASK